MKQKLHYLSSMIIKLNIDTTEWEKSNTKAIKIVLHLIEELWIKSSLRQEKDEEENNQVLQ